MATIKVMYKSLGNSGVPIYHKYLVYVPDEGTPQYVRGGPTPGASPVGFGSIEMTSGDYVPGTVDYPPVGTTNDEEIIATGNLEDEWQKILERAAEIQAGEYQYNSTTQNSNSVVDDLLRNAGLPEPQQDDPWEHLTPGTGFGIFWKYPLTGFLPPWIQDAADRFDDTPNITSPLVLDLDGDGVETSALGSGAAGSSTYFDLDNDGFAERTGWAAGGDGLLALDKNNNGKIDDQNELFGNGETYADGFAALKALDSNNDNKITSADAQWSKLRVWVDADSDGVTDAGELKTLSSLKITQINLNATAHDNLTNNGNPVTASSTFVMNGKTRTVSDVWFSHDQTDTRYMGEVTLDPKVLFLPTLKGFGNLKDLHV